MSPGSPQAWVAAVGANVLSSAGNFALTVALARANSAQDFGWFATALLVSTLGVGCLRSAVLESAVRVAQEFRLVGPSVIEAARLSLPISLVGGGIALVLRRPEIAVVALAFPGLTIFDFLRNALLVGGRPSRALTMEVGWTLATFAAVMASLVDAVEPLTVLAVWAGAPTAVAAFVCWNYRGALRGQGGRYRSLVFGIDYLVGSGSSQVATGFLAFLGFPSVLGAIRAGGTLLSPVNLVTSALRPLLIARLAVTQSKVSGAVALATTLVALATPMALVAVLLPDEVGVALLGESWELARQVRIPLALEALLGMVTGVAFAGQRVLASGARVLATRLVLSVLRIVAIVVGVTWWGAVGAAWSLPLVTSVGVVVWWSGFVRLVKEKARETGE